MPGDTLVVKILDMWPRLPYGSNCAANWGLLYPEFGKERITIYELDDAAVRRRASDHSPRRCSATTSRPDRCTTFPAW